MNLQMIAKLMLLQTFEREASSERTSVVCWTEVTGITVSHLHFKVTA